jgi:hypothetical protein
VEEAEIEMICPSIQGPVALQLKRRSVKSVRKLKSAGRKRS